MYSGLYTLLRLGQQPNDIEIEDAANNYLEFINMEYEASNEAHMLNE